MHVPGIITVTSWGPWPSQRLSGILFTDDTIVIGDDGFAAFLARAPTPPIVEHLREGRFALVLADGDTLHARCDDMGQDTLYHYSDRERWAFSNSFLALCEALAQAGVRLQPYLPGLAAFRIGSLGLFGGQAVSNDTPIAGVRALPLDRALRVTRLEGASRLEVVPLPPPVQPAGYEETLVAYAETWRDRLHTLAARGPVGMSIDLSGGYDSRVCFGLAYPVLPDGSRFSIVSNPRNEPDVRPAALVRAQYGVPEGSAIPNPPTLDAEEAYRLWRLGNVGVYAPVYLPRHRTAAAAWRVHGGHFRASAYVALAPRDRLRRFERVLARTGGPVEGFAESFLGSFDEIGVALDDPDAMQAHYLHFRARGHYGRAWFQATRTFILTPLLSSVLLGVAGHQRTRSGTSQARWRQLTCDLLSLLDPALATIPFDDPKKAFRSEELQASPFQRSGGAVLRAPHVLRVYPERPAEPPVRREGIDLDVLHEGFARHAAQELARSAEHAQATGLLPNHVLAEARDGLREHESNSKGLARVARALTACAVADLCAH